MSDSGSEIQEKCFGYDDNVESLLDLREALYDYESDSNNQWDNDAFDNEIRAQWKSRGTKRETNAPTTRR